MHTLQVNQQLVAKISDYGMSHLRKTAQGAEHTVKPIWTAPEVNGVLSSDVYRKTSSKLYCRTARSQCHMIYAQVLKSSAYGKASDVYSFGVLLWEIFTRQVPFSHKKDTAHVQLIQDIVNGERPIVPLLCPARLNEVINFHMTLQM